ncbi:hypothetical protein [Pseudomonas moorei]|uniref:hypothetical protein n=1 Tax=Pseudomonas moorei TaxID=395599 RepID=UPI001FF45EAA|nr:hypothetical protein [Pseudomonas moorei]
MMMFQPLLTGIFAARVANRLIDLGIDVGRLTRLHPDLGAVLHEIERDRRKEFSPHEAAAYFIGAVFSNIDSACYIEPLSHSAMAYRVHETMYGWVEKGKMRKAWADSIQKSLRSQIEFDESPKQSAKKLFSPLQEFERELETWPKEQASAAANLIQATIKGETDRTEHFAKELTVQQFHATVMVIKKIEKYAGEQGTKRSVR